MLTIQSTPYATGATISGDIWDFDAFLTAAFDLIGETNKYYEYQSTHERLHAALVKLAAARKGKADVLLVSNGASRDQLKQQSTITPERNVYFGYKMLWPELLFTALGLNDFVLLRTKNIKHPHLHLYTMEVRLFQAKVIEALEVAMPDEDFSDVKQALLSPERSTEDYATQYVDMLALSYLNVPKEERKGLLPKIARNIIVGGNDYEAFKQKVIAEANKTKSAVHNIKLSADYPDHEDIDW
ncbi:hypothetical protein MKY84_00390 [Chryseomicrobium sp. FSL W7-1435]|uniref:DUF6904 family protein n=1 Tax=Chryseomicrobium sp. FSL W7-1435 TaxID=2921704 RepID=UPI00315B31D2